MYVRQGALRMRENLKSRSCGDILWRRGGWVWSRAATVDKSWMGRCGGWVGMWKGRWVGHGNWNLHRNWHLDQHLHRHLHLGVLLTNMVHLRRYRSSLVNNRATYLFVTLFSIGWLLHCVIFRLASRLIPEIILNPLVLFLPLLIFMVINYQARWTLGHIPGKAHGSGSVCTSDPLLCGTVAQSLFGILSPLAKSQQIILYSHFPRTCTVSHSVMYSVSHSSRVLIS